MKRIIIGLLILLLGLATRFPAFAFHEDNHTCLLSKQDVTDQLKKYQEQLIAIFITSTGMALHLYMSPDGPWTIVQVTPDDCATPLVVGDDVIVPDEPLQGDPT